mgnify:CR=1 FL=1
MFDAACQMLNLEGLYVKWSGIKSAEAICEAKHLRFFHLGSSPALTSIEPLRFMHMLEWLGLENIKRINNLEPIGELTALGRIQK